MSITGKIIKNVFSSWSYCLVQFGIGFFLMPFMIHRLGNEVYGYWITVMTLTGYLGFLEFGLRAAIVKYIPEFEVKKDLSAMNDLVNTSWKLYMILASASLVIASSFYPFISKLLKVDSAHSFEFQLSFLIMALNLFVFLFFLVFTGVLEGFKRQEIVSSIEVVAIIIQALFVLYFLSNGHGIVSLAVVMLSVNTLKQLARMVFIRRLYPQLKFRIFHSEKKCQKVILSYSMFSFSISAVRSAITSLPNLILATFVGPTYVTFYSVAARLTDYLKILLSTATDMLIPFVSGFNATNDHDRMQKSFLVGSKYLYGIVVLFAVCTLMLGKDFLHFWVGIEFANHSYPVLMIIVASLLCTPSAFVINAIFKGTGKLKRYTFYTIIECIASLIFTVVLIKKYTLIGVAFSFAVPYVINFGLIQTYSTLKEMNISVLTFFRSIIIRNAAPGVILAFFLFLLRTHYPSSNFISLSMQLFSSVIIYAVSCSIFLISKYERNYILSRLTFIKVNHR